MRTQADLNARRFACPFEPVTKAAWCVRLAISTHKERHLAARRGRDGSRQVLVEWDIQAVTGLLLANADRPFPNVLATHANDVRAALSGIEQQFEGEALPAAELMPGAKLFDIDFRPRSVTFGREAGAADKSRRIVRAEAAIRREAAEYPDLLQEIVCGSGRRDRFPLNQSSDMLMTKLGDKIVTKSGAKVFYHAMIGGARGCRLSGEVRRGVIVHDQR
jgi:hypothetical protein